MNNVNDIKESQLCYGCGTCSAVCGKNAIQMGYDNIGRLLPVINEEKCVDCGLCHKICPSLDSKEIQLPKTGDYYKGHVLNVYIGKAKDETIYRNSQSGGLLTAVLSYLFDTGRIDAAIVCKVVDEVEYTPKAVLVSSTEELLETQKSSYVPIDMVSAIKEAEHYHSIAVVGTGCHIQGFHALMDFKDTYREKIMYVLGLVCDRTLCKTATNVLYDNHFKEKKKRIIWRDKHEGYSNARLLIRTAEGEQLVLPRWQRIALKDPFTNPRCRICFDKLNVHADIVFGDPWSMSNVDWKNGMSLIITRTPKGQSLIDEPAFQAKVSLQAGSIGEVMKGQHMEKRRKEVSAAISCYQQNGWDLPSYASSLYVQVSDADCSAISKKIYGFIQDASLSKDDIIKKNKRLLSKMRWRKNKFAFFFRRIGCKAKQCCIILKNKKR